MKLSQDHEGDDQSVQAHTFGKSNEDEGFTKNGRVLADGAQSGGCSCGDGDAAAHAGEAGGESCGQVAEAGGGGRNCGSGLLGGVGISCEHQAGGYGHNSEEQYHVAGEGLLVAPLGFLAHGECAEGNGDAQDQCGSQCDFN